MVMTLVAVAMSIWRVCYLNRMEVLIENFYVAWNHHDSKEMERIGKKANVFHPFSKIGDYMLILSAEEIKIEECRHRYLEQGIKISSDPQFQVKELMPSQEVWDAITGIRKEDLLYRK